MLDSAFSPNPNFCEVIHRMDRRCRNWDYCGTGAYLITLVLNDRKSAALGKVALVDGKPAFQPSQLGEAVAHHAWRIPEFTPEIEVLAVQVMPDHIHFVLRVLRRLSRPLGEHLRGFKIGCSRLAECSPPACSPIHGRISSRISGRGEAARGRGLFADGFVDTILFSPAAMEKAVAYLADNPRRLWEKRAHPELFRVVRDLSVPIPPVESSPLACSPIHGRISKRISGRVLAHFSAIGNSALLRQPHLLQVQCSRSDFAYARDAQGNPAPSAPFALITPRFEALSEKLLAFARHGAVLVSPCISHGEKEIARRAFEAGCKVVALQNKGFSPLYKPGGKLFDHCAVGNLLLLAPAAWPYLPARYRLIAASVTPHIPASSRWVMPSRHIKFLAFFVSKAIFVSLLGFNSTYYRIITYRLSSLIDK